MFIYILYRFYIYIFSMTLYLPPTIIVICKNCKRKAMGIPWHENHIRNRETASSRKRKGTFTNFYSLAPSFFWWSRHSLVYSRMSGIKH